MATETNAFDWAATNWYRGNVGGWKWGNDTGHALVLFDILGQHLAHPRMEGLHVWNTRWFNSASGLENVLDEKNNVLPTGQVLGLWGHSLRANLQKLPDLPTGPAYATYDPSTQELTIFLMNKFSAAQTVSLDLSLCPMARPATTTVFAGASPEDTQPTLTTSKIEAQDSELQISLPPYSITGIYLDHPS